MLKRQQIVHLSMIALLLWSLIGSDFFLYRGTAQATGQLLSGVMLHTSSGESTSSREGVPFVESGIVAESSTGKVDSLSGDFTTGEIGSGVELDPYELSTGHLHTGNISTGDAHTSGTTHNAISSGSDLSGSDIQTGEIITISGDTVNQTGTTVVPQTTTETVLSGSSLTGPLFSGERSSSGSTNQTGLLMPSITHTYYDQEGSSGETTSQIAHQIEIVEGSGANNSLTLATALTLQAPLSERKLSDQHRASRPRFQRYIGEQLPQAQAEPIDLVEELDLQALPPVDTTPLSTTSFFPQGVKITSAKGNILTVDDLQLTALDHEPDLGAKEMIQGVELGRPDDHLVFSEPIQIDIAVDDSLNSQAVEILVLHDGDTKYSDAGISIDPQATCYSDGSTDKTSNKAVVQNGTVSFLTCGASTFVVTYVGGATFDNFVDNDTLDKTISITTGDVSSGTTIQDINVIVNFQPIDSEDPSNFGTTNAYSDEVSMSLTHPDGTTSVDLLVADTYTDQSFAPRVTVTFDDAASSLPSGLPATGTFLPNQSLSVFNGLGPLGDWIFTIGDDTNLDGVTLHSVSLEITDDATCGNGLLEGAEGCDDGGTTTGDGCNDNCLVEISYACNSSSSGAQGDSSCASSVCDETETTPTCEAANICGNGLVEAGEQCDDGGTANGDGCSATCQIEFCGDGSIDLVPTPGGTLFVEDFDSLNNGTATSSGTVITSRTGYSLTYQNSGSPARARYGNTAVQTNGGTGAITLDVSSNNNLQTNYLIFEVDLSDAGGATDLELAFDFSHHGEESNTNDRVRIRGSNTDTRILFYDRDANKGANGAFTPVNGLDIDASLASNNQQVSSTFQIRFGQEDNFPASSTTANDGLTIDNIEITGTPYGPVQDETCDDANTTDGDGCDSSCQVEAGYSCNGEPSICTVCGDGSVDGGETCDDSNLANGDGCSATCQIESGRTCNGAPSNCSSTCGDGIPVGSEQCDDGGTSSGDGCDGSCLIETGRSCIGTPSVCTNGCGDGTTGGSERCDDGNTTNGDGCSAICQIEFCGDGLIEETAIPNETLLLEDFESIGNGTTTTSGDILASSTGYTLTYGHNGSPARARYGSTAIQDNGGQGAITLDVGTDNNLQTNFLYVALDLSDAVGANDLTLDFDFSHHGEESNTNDRVWIRGSDTDSRLEIYDRDANKGTAGSFVSVTNLDIDALLSANNQIVSDTFQIRFGQEDNFSASSTTANDGLTIDNIRVMGTRSGPSVDETCDDGNTSSGDGCSSSCQTEPGYTCNGEPSICTAGSCDSDNVIISQLIENVGASPQTVLYSTFTTKTYTGAPIVLATPQTDNNGDNYPIPIIENITPTGFDISICVDDGNTTCATSPSSEDISIFVVDTQAANCTDHIQVGSSSITTDGSNTAFAFASSFTNTPYIFTTPQTSSQGGNIAAVARVDDNTLTTTGGNFIGCVHQGVGNNCTTGQPDETLGWIAIDPVLFTMSGRDTDTSSINNSTWTNVSFTQTYTSPPPVMVTQNSDNGGQDPQYARARNVTTGSADVRYCEQDGASSCDNHTAEDVMWFSLPSSQPPSASGIVSVDAPIEFIFTGISTDSTNQTGQAQFSGYFQLQDTLGSTSGYYTTLAMSDLTGVSLGEILTNNQLERFATGINLLSGDANTGVQLASGWSSYRQANSTYTFIKRDSGVGAGLLGTYGTRPRLKVTIPPYTKPDTYEGVITYTLYEN